MSPKVVTRPEVQYGLRAAAQQEALAPTARDAAERPTSFALVAALCAPEGYDPTAAAPEDAPPLLRASPQTRDNRQPYQKPVPNRIRGASLICDQIEAELAKVRDVLEKDFAIDDIAPPSSQTRPDRRIPEVLSPVTPAAAPDERSLTSVQGYVADSKLPSEGADSPRSYDGWPGNPELTEQLKALDDSMKYLVDALNTPSSPPLSEERVRARTPPKRSGPGQDQVFGQSAQTTEVLAQALAGLGSSVFNWSIGTLSRHDSLSLLEIVLKYLQPCYSITRQLSILYHELKREQRTLEAPIETPLSPATEFYSAPKLKAKSGGATSSATSAARSRDSRSPGKPRRPPTPQDANVSVDSANAAERAPAAPAAGVHVDNLLFNLGAALLRPPSSSPYQDAGASTAPSSPAVNGGFSARDQEDTKR